MRKGKFTWNGTYAIYQCRSFRYAVGKIYDPRGMEFMNTKIIILAVIMVGQALIPDGARSAEDMLTQSAKWMKISGYIIGTAVSCGVSEDEATPIGGKIVENASIATGNNIARKALAEIHVQTFLGAIKSQNRIGKKGCDVAIQKYEKLKNMM